MGGEEENLFPLRALVCVCVCACVRVCVRACMGVCVRVGACMRVHTCMHACVLRGRGSLAVASK